MFPLHKKVVISILLAVIVIGGSVYSRFFKDKNIFSFNSIVDGGLTAENQAEDTANLLQSDSDNDGLKYWEEALRGTDPDNSDTDGDGTKDGDEVREGRVPTLSGPDDKIRTTNPDGTPSSGTSGTSTANSLTDSIARSLYANYAVLGQVGDMTPESQDKITSDLSNSVSKILEPKTYALGDIKIAGAETPVSIKKYGNDIVLALNTSLTQRGVNEAISLSNYLDKKESAELQKVVTSANDYKNTLSALLKLPAPKSAAGQHLALVNAVGYFGKAIEGMTMVDSDPIVALISLKNFQIGEVMVADSLHGLVSYFEDKKIIFTNKDYGYIFSRSI